MKDKEAKIAIYKRIIELSQLIADENGRHHEALSALREEQSHLEEAFRRKHGFRTVDEFIKALGLESLEGKE